MTPELVHIVAIKKAYLKLTKIVFKSIPGKCLTSLFRKRKLEFPSLTVWQSGHYSLCKRAPMLLLSNTDLPSLWSLRDVPIILKVVISPGDIDFDIFDKMNIFDNIFTTIPVFI